MHVHHKSDLSEGSDEFAHFARIQKVSPEGSDFDNIFFMVVEGIKAGVLVKTSPSQSVPEPTKNVKTSHKKTSPFFQRELFEEIWDFNREKACLSVLYYVD